MYYAPILPMILVNGCSGIGTGWSSDVPCFNPSDLMAWILHWLDHGCEVEEKNGVKIETTPELIPWYKGFTGTITMDGERAITRGVFQPYAKKKDAIEITELPIGVWTEKYKNQIEDWYEAKQLGYRANYSTIDKVNFVVVPEDKFEMNEKNLKLVSYVSMANMVAFDTEQHIHKYKHVEDIMKEYCTTRLTLYEKRKVYQIQQLEHMIRVASNKIRFLTEVMKDDLVIFRKTDTWVQEELVKRKYDKEDGAFSYLLQMSIQSFTADKIDELTKQCALYVDKQKKVKQMAPSDMWKKELLELKQILEKK
jgi:DNA topoisomerase-2